MAHIIIFIHNSTKLDNNNLRNLFKNPNVVAFVKSNQIQWLGHVWRAEGSGINEILYTRS